MEVLQIYRNWGRTGCHPEPIAKAHFRRNVAEFSTPRPRESRAYEARLLRRQGHGNSRDPYRYRLPDEDDEYWDRGELPPLRGLEELPLPREWTGQTLLKEAKRRLSRPGGAGGSK
jgi:hypothetical protein